jgi:uncharacterized protein (DUF4213/DUF364 family)
MTVVETLLANLPTGCHVTDLYVGVNWILSLVNDTAGTQLAGVASTPKQIAAESRFQIGHYALNEDAQASARLLLSDDPTTAAVGLATVNALNRHDETTLHHDDAANWLSAQSANRRIAVFGRFPFIDGEIRPYARNVWVFEQEPQGDELNVSEIARVLPQADIVALTGSTVINHTIDTILPHIKPGSLVVVLGPSTPLSAKLFTCGIDALFGVRVTDVQRVVESVLAGEGFQKMQGLQRVALFKPRVEP